jgi:inosine triphosphate pyrophosphatase
MLYFITGNKNKFDEVAAILPGIEQLDIDLPEIQELDPHEIIKAKLTEAFKHKSGEFIVEDTSLYFDCLNGLPGPLIKWFLKTVGNEGLANIVEKMGNKKAQAKTMIGYATNTENVNFFEGVVEGEIVQPRVPSNFGWDPIFKPSGYSKTFAEMEKSEKNEISMRRMAVNNLKDFLGK